MDRSIVTITPTPPYDFDLTPAYATYFRGQYAAESLRDGVFRRLLDCRGQLCLVGVRALGRTDGFPHGDLVLRRLLEILVNGGFPLSPEAALQYSRRWSPFRSYITTYLFAAARSGRFAHLSRAGQVGRNSTRGIK